MAMYYPKRSRTFQITYGRYELTKTRLKEFLKTEYKLLNIPIMELISIFIVKFFLFLQNEYNAQ